MAEDSRPLWVDRFPDDLRRRVKANAALEGLTLRDALIRSAEGWCDEREAVREAVREVIGTQ